MIPLLLIASLAAPDITIIQGSASEVHRVCGKASNYTGPDRILACALPSRDRCIIIWPEDRPASGWLWHHEMAHCHGWRH